jgi:hypothetical protein
MSVYKISGGGLTYFGSTKQSLDLRFSNHKRLYRAWKAGSKGYCSSFELFETGIENCKIELLEQPKTIKERERFYIENNVCVNIKIPNRTGKEFRDTHKEQIRDKRKESYEINKEKINELKMEKFTCECGGKYARRHLSTHLKTKKHKLHKDISI